MAVLGWLGSGDFSLTPGWLIKPGANKVVLHARNAEEIGPGGAENVFKYVAPKSLFVYGGGKKRVAALLCDYRFDEEDHGIAVVFENERFREVTTQDRVL